jgi:hypothetical protein
MYKIWKALTEIDRAKFGSVIYKDSNVIIKKVKDRQFEKIGFNLTGFDIPFIDLKVNLSVETKLISIYIEIEI